MTRKVNEQSAQEWTNATSNTCWVGKW